LPGFELIQAHAVAVDVSEKGGRREEPFLLRNGKLLFTPTKLQPAVAYGSFLDAFHRGPWDEAGVLEVTRLYFELGGGCADNLVDSKEALTKAVWDCFGQDTDLPEGVEEKIIAGLEKLAGMLPEDPRPRVNRVENGFAVHVFVAAGFPSLEEWIVNFPDRGPVFDVELLHAYAGPNAEGEEDDDEDD
jgi:hypothetical protein